MVESESLGALESILLLIWIFVSVGVCFFAGVGLASHLLKEPQSSERLRDCRRRLEELERQLDLDLQRAFEQSPDNPYDPKYTEATDRQIFEAKARLAEEESYRSTQNLKATAAAIVTWFVVIVLPVQIVHLIG